MNPEENKSAIARYGHMASSSVGATKAKPAIYNEFNDDVAQEVRRRTERVIAEGLTEPHATLLPIAIALARCTARKSVKESV